MEPIYIPAPTPQKEEHLRSVVLGLYLLFIAGFFTAMLTTFIAIILAHVKKSDAQGSIYHSHIAWFLTTCWVNIAAFVVLVPSSVVLFFYTFTHSNNWLSVGIFVAGASFFVFLAFWDLYRIVKGIWRWSEQRAVV